MFPASLTKIDLYFSPTSVLYTISPPKGKALIAVGKAKADSSGIKNLFLIKREANCHLL